MSYSNACRGISHEEACFGAALSAIGTDEPRKEPKYKHISPDVHRVRLSSQNGEIF